MKTFAQFNEGIGGNSKIAKIARELQAGQGDGDVIDMLMAKGYSWNDLEKAAKLLGADNVEDFLNNTYY